MKLNLELQLVSSPNEKALTKQGGTVEKNWRRVGGIA